MLKRPSHVLAATLATLLSLGVAAPAHATPGDLYVSNGITNTIEQFTSGGTASVFASTGLNRPVGLAFDAAGNLYASNFTTGTIERFTPGGTASVFASGLTGPQFIAFDSSGNLYVAQNNPSVMRNGGIIERITPDDVMSAFATGLNSPLGLTFDAAGDLYVAQGNDSIAQITPTGTMSVLASTGTKLNRPVGLAFDAAGTLYAAIQKSSTIEAFTPPGGTSVFANGSSGQNSFAFQPVVAAVPEPASAAVLALGLGGLGLLRQRR